MISKIYITGDLIRPNPDGSANQISNIDWLYNLISFQIEKVSHIKPERLIRTTEKTTIQDWVQTENINVPCWHLMQKEFQNINHSEVLVIGFELPKNTKYQFEKKGIRYIDVIIHPIRYLADIIPAIKSFGIPKIQENFVIKDDAFYVYANILKTQMQRVSMLNIENDTALIVGQTRIDRSLFTEEGKILNLLDFKKEILKICQKHAHVVFKPHPYETDPEVFDFMVENNIEITDKNIYALLANKNISTVCGISSSVLYEAKYFNKEVQWFFPRNIDDYLPIRPDLFLSFEFWSNIFGGQTNEEYWLLPSPHLLRKSLNSWWGHYESPLIIKNEISSEISSAIDFISENILRIIIRKIKKKLSSLFWTPIHKIISGKDWKPKIN